jgi:uncharacterized protein YndB with AHSA1/START domain
MEIAPIVREIEIAAAPEAVWRFVATPDGLRAWWSESESVQLEARPGGRFELRIRFGDRRYRITGRVAAYDPPRTFALTWREEDGEWGRWPAETVVTVTLTPSGGKTRVRVEHGGFERLPETFRDLARRSYEGGWTAEEMARLRALAERGGA